jgi:mono/diheme cytochrome c family protein
MMKWWLSLAALVGCLSGSAWARDLGSEVRSVFAAKCAVCHGPDLAKPRGRFGYVLDLPRIAANPEMVIPGQPTESELWMLVQRDEMPPPDSPAGALTTDQKEIVRTWIAAGAPAVSPGTVDSPPVVVSEPPVPAAAGMSAAERLFYWPGKFHLLLLHFPIALVVAAGVGEVWSMWRRDRLPSETVRFCLWLAALAALPTAGLGWLFAAAGNGVSSPGLLTAHRWLGTAAAVWLVVTAVCAEGDARRGMRSRASRLLLATGVFLTALTAHVGGLMAHGANFFTE